MAWFMALFVHRDRSSLSGEINPEEPSTVLGDTVDYTIQSSAKIVKKRHHANVGSSRYMSILANNE